MFESLGKHLHSQRQLKVEEVDDSIYQFRALRQSMLREDFQERGVLIDIRLDEFHKRMLNWTKCLLSKKLMQVLLTP